MKKLMISLALVSSTMFFSGCSQKALSADRAGTISQTYIGVVKNVEMVKIQGDGAWTSLFGMIVGGVLGHQVGGGTGKELATIGGSIAGSIAGAEADVNDAQRITVEFDSGKTITTVLPLDFNNSTKYKSGDRVTVYITGNRVTEIR
jgi:outer membrane lipoprotein SlyB